MQHGYADYPALEERKTLNKDHSDTDPANRTILAPSNSQLAISGVGVEKVSANWLIFMKSVWQCPASSGMV
jgi:hypothetical protein